MSNGFQDLSPEISKYLIYIFKDAQLEEHTNQKATTFGPAPAPVAQATHEYRAAYLLHMYWEACLQPLYVLLLVVQVLRAHSVKFR